jgi:DNA invertase Pin-like site-specific DNA recombinase
MPALSFCRCDCLLAVPVNLSPAERKAQRKQRATMLYQQGFTEENIALLFGVSQSTIRDDLSDLVVATKSKHAKTKSNPKGAGRPKGSYTPKPRNLRDVEQQIIDLSDQGTPAKEIAEEVGVVTRTVHRILKEEDIRRTAEPHITPDMLSMTAQQKLEAAAELALDGVIQIICMK